jgi:AmmeMemoRadiSam system protein A
MEKEKGDILIKLARKTIAENLGVATGDAGEMETALKDSAFLDKRGIFVTLTIDKQLRGCIGNLSPDKTILEGVRDNAVNAAFYDPRFPALTKKELEAVDIEISLLTEPRPLAFSDAGDLLARLRLGIDGVIIRKGGRSATFLPQVWDQLPDKKMFLSHLCSKAGLPVDAWRSPGLEVQVYQVQYFHERR